MQLPPCHTLAQWNVSSVTDSEGKHFLDCKLFMRSNDIFLGMPFNVAQYAMLTEMLAHAHGLTARFFHVTEGDAHIYLNHMDAVAKQLQRPIIHKAPKLKINCGPVDSIRGIKVEDIELVGYESYDTIKAPIAGN
jgi:thymidylate synthase